jgi:hypothetical protein
MSTSIKKIKDLLKRVEDKLNRYYPLHETLNRISIISIVDKIIQNWKHPETSATLNDHLDDIKRGLTQNDMAWEIPQAYSEMQNSNMSLQYSTNMLDDRSGEPEINKPGFFIPHNFEECYTLLQHIDNRMKIVTGQMEGACKKLYNAFSGVDTTIENALLWFKNAIITMIIPNEPYFVLFKITKILVDKSIIENVPISTYFHSKLPIGVPNFLTNNIQDFRGDDIPTDYENTHAWTTMMRYKPNTPLTLSDLKQFLRFLEIKESSKKTVVSSSPISRDNLTAMIPEERYTLGYKSRVFLPSYHDSSKKEEKIQSRSRDKIPYRSRSRSRERRKSEISRSRSMDEIPRSGSRSRSRSRSRSMSMDEIPRSRSRSNKNLRKPHKYGGKKTKKRRPKNK